MNIKSRQKSEYSIEIKLTAVSEGMPLVSATNQISFAGNINKTTTKYKTWLGNRISAKKLLFGLVKNVGFDEMILISKTC